MTRCTWRSMTQVYESWVMSHESWLMSHESMWHDSLHMEVWPSWLYEVRPPFATSHVTWHIWSLIWATHRIIHMCRHTYSHGGKTHMCHIVMEVMAIWGIVMEVMTIWGQTSICNESWHMTHMIIHMCRYTYSHESWVVSHDSWVMSHRPPLVATFGVMSHEPWVMSHES